MDAQWFYLIKAKISADRVPQLSSLSLLSELMKYNVQSEKNFFLSISDWSFI